MASGARAGKVRAHGPRAMGAVQHRMSGALCCHAVRRLEARRPAAFGGLGDGVGGAACPPALRVAANKKEASRLRRPLAGAPWRSTLVCRRGLRTVPTCPLVGLPMMTRHTSCGTARSGGLAPLQPSRALAGMSLTGGALAVPPLQGP